MKRLFKFRYPKITFLIILIIFTYYLFQNPAVISWTSSLDRFGYISIFIAGLFLSFGFSAPIVVGFFLTVSAENIFLSALVGGFGALIGDILIFKLIKLSFLKEFQSLENTHPAKRLNKIMHKDLGKKLTNYLLYTFAGFVIASPLPDEIGVTMLAGLTHIKLRILSIIAFVLHVVGILAIFYVASFY